MRSHSYKIISAVFFVFIILSSCTKNEAPETVQVPLTPYSAKYPYYFPAMDIPADNPLTVEGIALGNRLYYDTLLSLDGRTCSGCHKADEAFSSYTANSLPHINLGWNSNFLWNGKVSGTLEDIMRFEVNVFFMTDVAKLNNSPYYKSEFKKVFNVNTITTDNVAFALAQFFRVMNSSNSRFDQYFQHTANLTNSELNGFVLFTTEKGDCFHCHSVGLFTDNKFHNIGIDSVFTGIGSGRYNITGNTADMGLFKTPTLRNIALTSPYMHDGRFLTLEEVIEHYNSGVKHSSTLDPIMTKPSKEFGLQLSLSEKQDLVAFLKALTDTSFTKNPLLQKP